MNETYNTISLIPDIRDFIGYLNIKYHSVYDSRNICSIIDLEDSIVRVYGNYSLARVDIMQYCSSNVDLKYFKDFIYKIKNNYRFNKYINENMYGYIWSLELDMNNKWHMHFVGFMNRDKDYWYWNNVLKDWFNTLLSTVDRSFYRPPVYAHMDGSYTPVTGALWTEFHRRIQVLEWCSYLAKNDDKKQVAQLCLGKQRLFGRSLLPHELKK